MTCWLCKFETTELAKAPICKDGPCQICTEVTEVDEEINQAVATLRRLLAKRSDILSEHNRVHGTLIHQLPVELKSRIFELLLPSCDDWGVIYGSGMQSFLAAISVCRGWRDVALSNPFLWSTMHIDLKTPDICSGINDWILRSRALPLTLHIQGDCTPTGPGLSLVDTLSHCSNRLQSLSLEEFSSPISDGSQYNNFQYHRLTQLRIISPIEQSLSLLNPTASPKMVELYAVSLRSLQISWNRLIHVTATYIDLEDFTLLFQQATQMTFCEISHIKPIPSNFSMPPIIHHRLKTLELYPAERWDAVPDLLVPLTLPCLRKVSTNELTLLTQLPALVCRSSCPLTSLTLFLNSEDLPFDESGPLPGVTDVVIENCADVDAMTRLLLGEYLPDLRHLTLGFNAFEMLWDIGVIPSLLDRKRPRLDDPNGGRLHKFIVVKDPIFVPDRMWISEIWDGLKEFNVAVREDGFELLTDWDLVD